VVRSTTAAAVAVALAMSVAVATAAAAPLTVAQAIQSQDRIFTSSPGYTLLSHFKVKSAAQAKVAVPKLEHTRQLLETAASVVARTPASTSTQRTGRTEWVAGARLVASGIGQLATGLRDLVAGNKAAADRALKLSVSLDKRGGVLAAKGDNRLGLPSTD
jgi:X-X-X-Leu-X-X-Gly heptad repeat protein